MKKDFLIIGGLFVVIIVFLIISSFSNVFLQNLAPQAASTTQVKIGNLVVTAEVAKTPQVRSKGLSNRESLPQNSGMLFVFEKEERYSFWMKNMKFPIDIIWIDQDKQIADITHSAQPEPGVADNLLKNYRSSAPILYVLEVSGGAANIYNLKIDDPVEFTI